MKNMNRIKDINIKIQKVQLIWSKSNYDKPRQRIKKLRHRFDTQSYNLSSSHVWTWELSHKETWVLKNWCFQIVVLEKTLESPLDCKEIQPVNPKGNQPWILTGRNDAEAPILWPPEQPTHWKRPWCWERLKTKVEEGRVAEDKMAREHHWFNKHKLGQTPGDSEGQGGLTYCSP